MLPELCSAGELRGGCLRPRGTPSTRSQPGRDALRGGPGRGQTSWWSAVPRSLAGDQNPFCRSRRLLGAFWCHFYIMSFLRSSGEMGNGWDLDGVPDAQKTSVPTEVSEASLENSGTTKEVTS